MPAPASYALRTWQSQGRRHAEPEHAYRDLFQRDRGRIIHSRAFRRLEDKTQVFTRRYSDHFRNRLTHTIEVSQITRTIAAELRLNPDLSEVLALVHDIGHPPFGHAGEVALDACMREHGLIFDHNLHALRIVEWFEQRYAAFRGLNLTFEIREGIIKHSRDYSEKEHPELAEYRLNEQPPLEAQLIDLADEIAYSTADLDDGVESGILTLEQIRKDLGVFDVMYQEVEKLYPNAASKLLFNEANKRLLDHFASDLIHQTRSNMNEAGVSTVEDVRTAGARLVGYGKDAEHDRKMVKQFLYDNLYFSADLRRDKDDAARVIKQMFAFWMSDASKLPISYQKDAESEPLARVVCDYIAGMTDTFALDQFRLHCGGKAFE